MPYGTGKILHPGKTFMSECWTMIQKKYILRIENNCPRNETMSFRGQNSQDKIIKSLTKKYAVKKNLQRKFIKKIL